MTPRLRFKLLGTFALEGPDGSTLPAVPRKARALLAYLALAEGQSASRERLVGLLWGDRDQRRARHSLNQALTAIRKVLPAGAESVLRSEEGLVGLDEGAVVVDALEVARIATSPEADDQRAAIELHAGELLDGLDVREPEFEDWLAVERDRLRATRCAVIRRMLASLDDAGRDAEAKDLARRALAMDPLDEETHRRLMALHDRTGEPAAALRQYRACAEALARELGVPPEPATTALHREIAGRRRSPPAWPAH